MTGYLNKGLLMNDKDLSLIIFNGDRPYLLNINLEWGVNSLLSCDNIYVEGDFNKHDLITVQLGTLSNGLEPEVIDCYSHFEVEVQIFENDETDLQVKDRNFKLEDLSMELQERIHFVAEKMRADKMKFIHY